ENTINGAVYIGKEKKTQQQSLIFKYNLFAHAECNIEINQHLLVRIDHPLSENDSLDEIANYINQVKSNQNALEQCAEFIKAIGAKAVAVDSTAAAAKEIVLSNNAAEAAIGSAEAAEVYNLKIIRKNIQDQKNNITRFFLVSSEKPAAELIDGYRCSIIVFGSKMQLEEKLQTIPHDTLVPLITDGQTTDLYRVDIDASFLSKIPKDIFRYHLGTYKSQTQPATEEEPRNSDTKVFKL
ncbi:MAG: prephenate dehydratase domain-containing protein, partial [Gammaproteobacteria bacterium]